MCIYLDNAATSFPKPESVYIAVEHAMRGIGVGPGRGGHRLAMEATRLVFEARELLAQLFGASDSSRFVFTHSATEGLNLALTGFLKPGDHVVTTSMEHNSLVRPLHRLKQQGITVTNIAVGKDGVVDPAAVSAAIGQQTRLLAFSHCSNVTGTVQPLEELVAVARKAGIAVLLDAAQSAGLIPLDLARTPVDLLAAPGHKGLLGPQGTGFLYVAPEIELDPLTVGGTGTSSESAEQPAGMPERFESGTLNMPGIAGLKAGCEFILQTGIQEIRNREATLAEALRAGLLQLPGVVIHSPAGERHAGPVSFTVDGIDPSYIGFTLDRQYDIAVRTGLHCAPEAHKSIGTWPLGTVRVSPGFWNTDYEIDRFLMAMKEIVASRRGNV